MSLVFYLSLERSSLMGHTKWITMLWRHLRIFHCWDITFETIKGDILCLFMGTLSLKLNVLKFTFHSRKKTSPIEPTQAFCSLYFSLSFPVNMFYTFLFTLLLKILTYKSILLFLTYYYFCHLCHHAVFYVFALLYPLKFVLFMFIPSFLFDVFHSLYVSLFLFLYYHDNARCDMTDPLSNSTANVAVSLFVSLQIWISLLNTLKRNAIVWITKNNSK